MELALEVEECYIGLKVAPGLAEVEYSHSAAAAGDRAVGESCASLVIDIVPAY